MSDRPMDESLDRLRIGIGHDRHRLIPGPGPLVIGGVKIPFEGNLQGHSDADVLLHSLTDAILGALGRGDIGEWFPDTAAENKGRDSREMLRLVLAGASEPPFRIINVDATIFAEAPKFSPHKGAIRDSMAQLLGIPAHRVNVKAKTGEKVGPIGRREAIDTEVVVLLEMVGST
jgi:2-C-methyl-D-erythritol 2,4-cyclodiphosphate synthase